ncbi:MAG TPA: DUF2188 domain-containing protein [Actinomycetota bacterium]|jgi:hypothetical protein|nr:DUF2188 domain-containing protein [Actinomycetota bacterium]
MGGAVVLGAVMLAMAGITLYLVGNLVKSIQNEKSTSMRLWKNFGLSLGFCTLFLLSWVGQAAAQWQEYTDQQREHKEPVELGDFAAQFSSRTLENWQSEFLQLFSFTVMAAILIHKGSAESRDSDDRIEAALKRIEDHLGTEPTLDKEYRSGTALHVLRDEAQGWSVKDESSPEPEGYYDTQEEAIKAARELARKRSTTLRIHDPDGNIRDETDYGSS